MVWSLSHLHPSKVRSERLNGWVSSVESTENTGPWTQAADLIHESKININDMNT